MTETDNTLDRRIDAGIVRAIEGSSHKKMTVREIGIEIHFSRGIITHLQEMRGRGLIMFVTPGEITMDTEVTLACG